MPSDLILVGLRGVGLAISVNGCAWDGRCSDGMVWASYLGNVLSKGTFDETESKDFDYGRDGAGW